MHFVDCAPYLGVITRLRCQGTKTRTCLLLRSYSNHLLRSHSSLFWVSVSMIGKGIVSFVGVWAVIDLVQE